jgi:uncharacterized protein (TIGR03067 family)
MDTERGPEAGGATSKALASLISTLEGNEPMIRLCQVLTMTSLFAGFQGPRNECGTDDVKLLGKWRLIAVEVDGTTQLVPLGHYYEFRRNDYARWYPDRVSEGQYTIDPTGDRNSIDFEYGRIPSWGIYAIEDDALLICTCLRVRPTGFSTSKGDERHLYVLVRENEPTTPMPKIEEESEDRKIDANEKNPFE